MSSKLIGKTVVIKDRNSIYEGEWGIIIGSGDDGEYYVAIANGRDCVPVFDRDQFVVRKNLKIK